MALTYCEVCGVLIQADQPQVSVPEGVICEGCFASRRVDPEEPAQADEPQVVQFNCCYCQSLLRLKAVPRRTRIRCPKCNDYFYLHEDGRIEAKLEGNTTAVLASPVLDMRPFTPAEGSRPATPATGSLPAPPPNKTQPVKRQPPLPEPAPSSQQALLRGLEPIKRMDFLDKLADKPRGEALVDTDAYASTAPLDLLPQSVGPGDAKKTTPREVSLRPSEEGQVDLDAEGLKKKTQKYARTGPQARGTGKRKAEEAEDEPPTKQGGKKKAAKPDDDEAARADLARDEERAREKREEKEKRAAEASRRAAEVEAQAAKQGLGALAVLALAALPVIVCGLLLSMTTRGTGFAVRGGVGDTMRDLGGVMDRGVRALGTTVNPGLPPGAPRLPETERRG